MTNPQLSILLSRYADALSVALDECESEIPASLFTTEPNEHFPFVKHTSGPTDPVKEAISQMRKDAEQLMECREAEGVKS